MCSPHLDAASLHGCYVSVSQQIAFKNLVQRNRQTEQQANRAPPPNSIIHLPFIIVNTSKKTVIDCSISSDKYATLLSPLAHFLSFNVPPVEPKTRGGGVKAQNDLVVEV